MFYNCSSIEYIPNISNWDTSEVKTMQYMFYKCSSLKYLPDISKWKLDNVKNKRHIFPKKNESITPSDNSDPE